MPEAAPATHFNLFLLRNFLDSETCAKLRAELVESPTTQAPVYIQGAEGTIHENIRKTTSMHPSRETVDRLHGLLLEQVPAVSKHFNDTLTESEPPQFLRYKKGDFFVRHQDGDPKQDDFDHLRVRRVSIVVFLNGFSAEPQADCYSGGVLNFYDQTKEFGLEGETGLLVAFTSDTFHEVLPVTDGERFTIITWFR
jgi:predicted 2-oxoglutarate/Fe(II)-dependent dioxygenase YbiX